MQTDPEQDFEVEVTFVLRGFGKRIHVEKLIERALNLLKWGQMNVEVKSTF